MAIGKPTNYKLDESYLQSQVKTSRNYLHGARNFDLDCAITGLFQTTPGIHRRRATSQFSGNYPQISEALIKTPLKSPSINKPRYDRAFLQSSGSAKYSVSVISRVFDTPKRYLAPPEPIISQEKGGTRKLTISGIISKCEQPMPLARVNAA